MKKLLNFSDFYVPYNELVERGYLSNDDTVFSKGILKMYFHFLFSKLTFYAYLPFVIAALSYFFLKYFNQTDLYISLLLLIFIITHLFCVYFNKKVPYIFLPLLVNNLIFRGIYPLVLIFSPYEGPNGEDWYSFMLSLVFYLFIVRIYSKGIFRPTYENIRNPKIYVKDVTKGKILSDAISESSLFYTECVIIILSLLLPFQHNIPFDIPRISLFLYSFNCFTLLFLVKPIRDLIQRIFYRLSRALLIFSALATFTLILATQLKNLYFIEYPNYFSDILTSLKTLTLIITGEFFIELTNNDTELYILVFGIYSFLGIILLSFFTAFLVDSEKEYKSKEILGRIDYKNVFLVYMYDSNKKIKTPIEVLYNDRIFKCGNILLEIDGHHQDYDIVDAAVLISKQEK